VNNKNALKVDFILPTQAFVGDTIVALDITKPIPNSITWFLPQEASVVLQNGSKCTFIPTSAGEKKIGLLAKAGDCQNLVFRTIKVFNLDEVDKTDPEYNYKTQPITNVVIFPNPNQGLFNLKIDLKVPTQLKMQLFKVNTGELVYSETLLPKTNALNAIHTYPFDLDLRQGIYSLVLEVGVQKLYYKIIITE
jgi:hypothetical protein